MPTGVYKRTKWHLKRLKERIFPNGENHAEWIKNPTNYSTLHYQVRYLYGKATTCENPECPGASKNYQWSNKDHKYHLKREDWEMLCVSCHRNYETKAGIGRWGRR